MAPSSGHILVPKVLKAFRFAISKTASFVRSRVPQATSVEAIPARINRQPIHPLAALRQSQSRYQTRNFSTAFKRVAEFASKTAAASGRASFPASAVRTALGKTTHAPFSSPLRPNLTGGAIPRSAGGYSLGGQGVRHFSHTPAANAQVVQNVGAAVRAFCYNGFQARFDGCNHAGEKRFRAVTVKQNQAFRKVQKHDILTARGTSLEFRIAPTITAVSSLPSELDTLENETVVSTLASDFSRNLASLARIHEDIKKLSTLGPLPISHPNPHTISVRFPGCDGSLVTALCDELGISRGIVVEDAAWAEENGDRDVEMALLFPWAPSKTASITSDEPIQHYFNTIAAPEFRESGQSLEWQSMLSPSHAPSRISNLPSSPSVDEKSLDSYSLIGSSPNPWRDEGSYDALRDSDLESNEHHDVDLDLGLGLTRTQTTATIRPENRLDHSGYEGLEGIYRFIAECDAAGRGN